jgi:hypothetical protein
VARDPGPLDRLPRSLRGNKPTNGGAPGLLLNQPLELLLFFLFLAQSSSFIILHRSPHLSFLPFLPPFILLLMSSPPVHTASAFLVSLPSSSLHTPTAATEN